MKTYRITKYNPLYRDKNDHFLKDEWVCSSQIGDYFDGNEFTAQEYVEIENKYITAVKLFLITKNLKNATLANLEKDDYDKIDNIVKTIHEDELENLFVALIENYSLSTIVDILNTVRLILRHHIWGEILLKDSNHSIEFGSDYYMYIITDSLHHELVKSIEGLGLFVEDI